jgi:hypothetical protein
MASPIRPSDIKDTLPNTDGSACARLKKVIVDFPRRVYDWFSYIYNEDGTFTDAFKEDFCAIKCDDVIDGTERPITVDNPGGNLSTPFIKAGAALRPNGGIPIVFSHVDGATRYDIYRGTTNTFTNVGTIRIRKGLIPSAKNMNAARSQLCKRRDGSILYVDVNGGPVYNSTTRKDDKNSNVVDGQTKYYYWVVAKNNSGAKSDHAGPAIGFSRYVTSFSAIGSPKTLWSSETETPTNLNQKTMMRVVLRGGGGAGGGGGDYNLVTFDKYYIKKIFTESDGSYTDGNPIKFTLSQIAGTAHNFKVGDNLILAGQPTANWDSQLLVVSEVLTKSDQFTCSAIGGLGDPVASSTLIRQGSDYSWGVIYALANAAPTRIPGGGGGAGGVLLAVFDISSITDVRVRTLDVAGAVVSYSNTNSNLFGSGYLGPKFPINYGGAGRSHQITPPQAGEPKANVVFTDDTCDTHTSKTVNCNDTGLMKVGLRVTGSGVPVGTKISSITSSTEFEITESTTTSINNTELTFTDIRDSNLTNIGPYKTVLEVKKGTSGGPGSDGWHPVAWVSDGEGGGYADDATSTTGTKSTKGEGSKQVYWKATTNTFNTDGSSGHSLTRYGTFDYGDGTANGATDVCSLRDDTDQIGAVFYQGADGTGGIGSLFAGTSGSPGVGGHAWDSLEPRGPALSRSNAYQVDRAANAIDYNAPGSGAYGAFGDSTENFGPYAYGGHAMAGGVYLTFATGSTGYDEA